MNALRKEIEQNVNIWATVTLTKYRYDHGQLNTRKGSVSSGVLGVYIWVHFLKDLLKSLLFILFMTSYRRQTRNFRFIFLLIDK